MYLCLEHYFINYGTSVPNAGSQSKQNAGATVKKGSSATKTAKPVKETNPNEQEMLQIQWSDIARCSGPVLSSEIPSWNQRPVHPVYILTCGKAIDEDGNPISVWNPDEEGGTDSDGKGRVSQVELFYSNGDICDITGEPREVIVRLKVCLLLLLSKNCLQVSCVGGLLQKLII